MAKKITIETLAGMIKRGFDATASKDDLQKLEQKVDGLDRKVDGLDKRVGVIDKKVDQGFQHINARLDLLRNDISDLPAMRQELRDLGQRVDRLEKSVKG
jgi:prefoldin subunit 5